MQLDLKTNISTSKGRTVRIIGVNEKDSKSEDGFFFNSKRFVQSRKLPGDSGWLELLDNTGKVVGSIFLTIDKKHAWSHLNAPFGSLEKNGKLTQNDCDFMISGLLRFLEERGVETLELTHYPHFYDPKTSEFVDHSYQSRGFKVISENVNQHLKIDQIAFKTKLTDAKKNRLSKWYRSGFMACQESVDSLAEAYKFILESRERKNFDLSMTFGEMHAMFISHPDHYFLFTVRQEEILVAVAISIKINKDILYTYAYADHEDYLTLSPTLLVVEEVYKFGQNNGYNFIDLGTSSQGGVLNKGVYQFKKELGALESVKREYVWNLKN